jgi:hypothetical protein
VLPPHLSHFQPQPSFPFDEARIKNDSGSLPIFVIWFPSRRRTTDSWLLKAPTLVGSRKSNTHSGKTTLGRDALIPWFKDADYRLAETAPFHVPRDAHGWNAAR